LGVKAGYRDEEEKKQNKEGIGYGGFLEHEVSLLCSAMSAARRLGTDVEFSA
jgi:hypothetical protein